MEGKGILLRLVEYLTGNRVVPAPTKDQMVAYLRQYWSQEDMVKRGIK